MEKKVAVAVVVCALIVVGAYVFSKRDAYPDPASQIPTLVPTDIVNSPTDPVPQTPAPGDWKTYTSQQYDFSIRYPTDVTHQTTSEGERFHKLGPTQSDGTELYDGISVMIKTGSLGGKPFAQFVNDRYEEIKNDSVGARMGDKHPVTIAGKPGIAFTVSTLGERTNIYLPKDEGMYYEIINGTVEPQNRPQTFQGIVNAMLSTLTSAP